MLKKFFTIISFTFLSFSLFAEGNLASQPTKLELEIRGDLSMNKQFLTSVLQGTGTKAQIEVVALNTALVLWASAEEENLSKGVKMALNSLET